MIDTKDLNAWLPGEAIKILEDRGITSLYPPQAEAIERGLLDGRNMLIALSTAAGKTMLAELAMLTAALQGKRALYIVPLKALATEKYESFKKFEQLGFTVGISIGDLEKKNENLGKHGIVIATSEKADSLVRNRTTWIEKIAILVIDEIHLLGDATRGPTLEMTITKLRKRNPMMQVIGLSATVVNAKEMAKWLDADIVLSNWRPVDLKERVIYKKEDKKMKTDETKEMVKETIANNAQILIFEGSRKNAEVTARKLCDAIGKKNEATDLAHEIRKTSDNESTQRLASYVEHGVSYHHAGLMPKQRQLVEQGFKDGIIKVISSTPTLAAGLNLPARRVLIKSYQRYDSEKGMMPIPVIEYRQMAGRAGRPGLDPYGESFILAKSEKEMEYLTEKYINGTPEKIESKLANESTLRTHVLSLIVAGFASNEQTLKEFMSNTFYAEQEDLWNLDETTENITEFLRKNGMIEKNTTELIPTKLGELVSRLYIDPVSAVIMINNVNDENISETRLLHVLTMTPDIQLMYVKAGDTWIEDFIEQNQGKFADEQSYDYFLKEVKAVSMMSEWIQETKESAMTTKYGIGQGDIHRIVETAEWLMHSLEMISKEADLRIEKEAGDLVKRIHYGAKEEMLELLGIKGIGRVRARKLFNAGIRSKEALIKADKKVVEGLIGIKITKDLSSL